MTIVDYTNLGLGALLGATFAFGLSWYWVRRYGADLETKVRETADKFEEKLKEQLNEMKKSK